MSSQARERKYKGNDIRLNDVADLHIFVAEFVQSLNISHRKKLLNNYHQLQEPPLLYYSTLMLSSDPSLSVISYKWKAKYLDNLLRTT